MKDIKNKINLFLKEQSWLLMEVSRGIHSCPEKSFEETFAANLLCRHLEQAGFEVDLNIAGMATAFIAQFDSKNNGPNVVITAEYDVIPGKGHICGHNLVAASTLGAALTFAALKDSFPGQITIIGTPGEEGGGGKTRLKRAGYFNKADAVMQVHPADRNVANISSLAAAFVKLKYIPVRKSKALQREGASTKAWVALHKTRQAWNRLSHFSFEKEELFEPEIISLDMADLSSNPLTFLIAIGGKKAETVRQGLWEFIKIANDTAGLTGFKLEISGEQYYVPINTNRELALLYENNWRYYCRKEKGHPMPILEAVEPLGATDIGCISVDIPTIQPYFAIAPLGTALHSEQFCSFAGSEAAYPPMLRAISSMLATSLDWMNLNSEKIGISLDNTQK